jgi:hypothetical protein
MNDSPHRENLYSSGTGIWTLTGSMAQGRELFPAVRLTGGKILVSGGAGAGSTVLAARGHKVPSLGTARFSDDFVFGKLGVLLLMALAKLP